MNNLEIAEDPLKFIEAYKKAKSTQKGNVPFNTSSLSLGEQLEQYEEFSFTEDDIKALHEDMLSI